MFIRYCLLLAGMVFIPFMAIADKQDTIKVDYDLVRNGKSLSYRCQSDSEPIICISVRDKQGKILVSQSTGPAEEYESKDGPTYIEFDANFDGQADIAIMDEDLNYTKTTGYSIYLADGHGGYIFSKALTDLAHSNDALFEVDKSNQTLITTHRVRLEWDETHVYKVINNIPVEIHTEIQEYFNTFYLRYVEKTLHNGHVELSITYPYPAETADGSESTHSLLSFYLLGKQKKVVVLEGNGIVDYLLMNSSDHIEYSALLAAKQALPWQMQYFKHSHFIRYVGKTPEFVYQKGSLSVKQGNTQYRIIDDGQRLGIEITQGKQVTFMPGDPKSKKGNLIQLGRGQYSNLHLA